MCIEMRPFQFVTSILLVVLLSSCGGSDSTGTDNQPGSGAESEGDVVDSGNETESNDPLLDQSGRFNGVWYGVLDPQGGLDATSFNEALIYEVSLQQQTDGFYTGTARVIADRVAGNIDITTFKVRAEVEGESIDIRPISTGENNRSIVAERNAATCETIVSVSVVDGELEGTWAAETGQCGRGLVVLDRLPEQSDKWYESLPDCPCQFSEDILGTRVSDNNDRPGTWVSGSQPGGVFGTGILDLTTHHPGGVYDIRWVPDVGANPKSGQQCIYDKDRLLITGGLGAGTPDLVSPGNLVTNTIGDRPLGLVFQHNWVDVSPFEGDDPESALSCTDYFQQWPPNNDLSCPSNVISPIVGDEDWSCARVAQLYTEGDSYIPPIEDEAFEPVAVELGPVTVGDPHIYTLDGLTYDFQAVGEFVLVETHSGTFEIQSRQARYPSSASQVSINIGFAFNIMGDTVSLISSSDDDLTLIVNGNTESVTGVIELPGGGTLESSPGQLTLTWPDGSRARVQHRGLFLDLYIGLTESYVAATRGLLGNFDGDPLNDLVTRDDSVLGSPIPAADLYGDFADSWRVTAENSLFTYQEGENTDTYTNRFFPSRVFSLDDLTKEERAEAEAQCRAAGVNELIEQCILDYAATGDQAFITSANESETMLNAQPTETIISGEIGPISELRLSDLVGTYRGSLYDNISDTSPNGEIQVDLFENDDGALYAKTKYPTDNCSGNVATLTVTQNSGSRFIFSGVERLVEIGGCTDGLTLQVITLSPLDNVLLDIIDLDSRVGLGIDFFAGFGQLEQIAVLEKIID